MIRIPLRARSSWWWWWPGRAIGRTVVRRGGGRRRADRLVNELQLGHVDLDVVLAHAEEAADADHDAFDLAGLVEQDFADVAQLFILVVVDVQADQLRRTPSCGLRHRSGGRSRGRRSRRSWREAGGLDCARAGTIITEASSPPIRSLERMRESPGWWIRDTLERAEKILVPGTRAAEIFFVPAGSISSNRTQCSPHRTQSSTREYKNFPCIASGFPQTSSDACSIFTGTTSASVDCHRTMRQSPRLFRLTRRQGSRVQLAPPRSAARWPFRCRSAAAA